MLIILGHSVFTYQSKKCRNFGFVKKMATGKTSCVADKVIFHCIRNQLKYIYFQAFFFSVYLGQLVSKSYPAYIKCHKVTHKSFKKLEIIQLSTNKPLIEWNS